MPIGMCAQHALTSLVVGIQCIVARRLVALAAGKIPGSLSADNASARWRGPSNMLGATLATAPIAWAPAPLAPQVCLVFTMNYIILSLGSAFCEDVLCLGVSVTKDRGASPCPRPYPSAYTCCHARAQANASASSHAPPHVHNSSSPTPVCGRTHKHTHTHTHSG